MKGRRETTVNAENLGGYDGSDGETVEDVNEGFPGLDVTAAFTLVIETIY